jgi:hypothetical protein
MNIRRFPALDHSGSGFDGFLKEDGIQDQDDAMAIKRESDKQLDDAAQADAQEGIRQGLEDAENGRIRPIREFSAEFEAAHPELGQRMRNRPRTA